MCLCGCVRAFVCVRVRAACVRTRASICSDSFSVLWSTQNKAADIVAKLCFFDTVASPMLV
jgi:hypothetical protein